MSPPQVVNFAVQSTVDRLNQTTLRARPEPKLNVLRNLAWPLCVAAVFVAALLLRLQNLDASPYGDEAYYYFITHDLHAYWDASSFPVSGSTFPVFPLLYHLVAGNLLSLRLAPSTKLNSTATCLTKRQT
jgi:hypothetical protein